MKHAENGCAEVGRGQDSERGQTVREDGWREEMAREEWVARE
jgi:hypothetical protein